MLPGHRNSPRHPLVNSHPAASDYCFGGHTSARIGSGVATKGFWNAWLGSDAVVALPGRVLRRLDLLAGLAAENAHEAAHRMLLPSRCPNDLIEADAVGPQHHCDHLGLFVVRLWGRAA